MKIAILKERRPHEKRVAVSPETVKKYKQLGASVVIETGAGDGAKISDEIFMEAGAEIAKTPGDTVEGATLIFKVQPPMTALEGEDEISLFSEGQTLVCVLNALTRGDIIQALVEKNVRAMAMELVPRISRAQSMDVLSSQANIAGYKAVLDAQDHYARALPLMMTAAGTVPPAKVFIMGVGVAGLQAIATARRLGAVVSATDVRPATEEQVQSLGAEFIAVKDDEFLQAQTDGGYAKEMSAEYKKKQADLISETLKKQDIVITTALIPGRPAPVLITEEMVKSMKPGAVIVDLAVEAGGNCPLSEFGKIVEKHNVTLVGHANVPSRVAESTSLLFAKNILNFISPFLKKEEGKDQVDLVLNYDDEIIKGTLVCEDGATKEERVTDNLKNYLENKDALDKEITEKAQKIAALAVHDASDAKDISAKKAKAKKSVKKAAKKAAAKKSASKKAASKKAASADSPAEANSAKADDDSKA